MAPDFEYFFTMSDQSSHGHTLSGVFYFDVPVTLLTAYIFHRLVKLNLINNLPYFIQRKFYVLKIFQFEGYLKKHWLLFLISAISGALSHLFWDSFTHPNTWAEQNFSIYDTVIPFHGARYPLYYALQVFSSYFGLALLIVYFLNMKSSPMVELVKPSVLYWLLLIALSGAVFFLRFYLNPGSFNFVLSVISSISALSIALIVAGLFYFPPNVKKQNHAESH